MYWAGLWAFLTSHVKSRIVRARGITLWAQLLWTMYMRKADILRGGSGRMLLQRICVRCSGKEEARMEWCMADMAIDYPRELINQIGAVSQCDLPLDRLPCVRIPSEYLTINRFNHSKKLENKERIP